MLNRVFLNLEELLKWDERSCEFFYNLPPEMQLLAQQRMCTSFEELQNLSAERSYGHESND